MASTVPDGTDNGDYATIDALLASMDRIEHDLQAADDPRRFFHSTYSRTTRAVRDEILRRRLHRQPVGRAVGRRLCRALSAGLRAVRSHRRCSGSMAGGLRSCPRHVAAAAAPRAARDERAHQLRLAPGTVRRDHECRVRRCRVGGEAGRGSQAHRHRPRRARRRRGRGASRSSSCPASERCSTRC